MYEGMVGTNGVFMWSRNNQTRSVGPLQPLTMGLITSTYIICGIAH